MTRHVTVASLVESGLLAPDNLSAFEDVERLYAVALTHDLADLIDRNDPHDPIAAQFLPDQRELIIAPHEIADPTADRAHSPLAGIVHRYPDRVLLKLLHICPVYCRFCFRREVVGPEGSGSLSTEQEQAALDYIAQNSGIWEVILTGGDPFMLSIRRLQRIMQGLKAIPHVKIIRFHSRVPVASPSLITRELVEALSSSGKVVYVAVHANHPRELTEVARAACGRFVDAGISLLSQSVLLKGVNDSLNVMEALMRAFVEARIKPYYVHQLDPAPGTSHWHVPIHEGRQLMRGLRGRLSGIAQPLYVMEQPNGQGKVPIGLGDEEALFDALPAVP
jgi:lysine 2,3-aminomutase